MGFNPELEPDTTEEERWDEIEHGSNKLIDEGCCIINGKTFHLGNVLDALVDKGVMEMIEEYLYDTAFEDE